MDTVHAGSEKVTFLTYFCKRRVQDMKLGINSIGKTENLHAYLFISVSLTDQILPQPP